MWCGVLLLWVNISNHPVIVRVVAGGSADNKTSEESGLSTIPGIALKGIYRGDELSTSADPGSYVLRANDVLLLSGVLEYIQPLWDLDAVAPTYQV